MIFSLCCLRRRFYTTITVASALKNKDCNKCYTFFGWVKSLRRHKEVTFIGINDGSCPSKLQVVIDSNKCPKELRFHSSVTTCGKLQLSSHPGQDVELIADNIQVMGTISDENYPFKARVYHSPYYIRPFVHLRQRLNSYSSIMRLRSKIKQLLHNYYNDKGFVNIDTPIITVNDCEGGGETFYIKTEHKEKVTDEFFIEKSYLTVSGQLHLEAAVSGLSRVYAFNPAFRAENSHTRNHLSEFWMLEVEEAFIEGYIGLSYLTEEVEKLFKYVAENILDLEDLLFLWKSNPDAKEIIKKMQYSDFVRITYTDTIQILKENKLKFKVKPNTGADLAKEHENFLTEYMGNVPVFVTEWPASRKPFYMAQCLDKSDMTLSFDLLVPNVGEVVGGGLRLGDYDILKKRISDLGLQNKLDWYLHLRKYGACPTGGFGLGFERLLQYFLGIPNIKDTVPFPRWSKHCNT